MANNPLGIDNTEMHLVKIELGDWSSNKGSIQNDMDFAQHVVTALEGTATIGQVAKAIRAANLRARAKQNGLSPGLLNCVRERVNSSNLADKEAILSELSWALRADHVLDRAGLRGEFAERSFIERQPFVARVECIQAHGRALGPMVHAFKRAVFSLTKNMQARRAGLNPETLEYAGPS